MNTNFKKVSYRKIDWLRNISDNGGAMNEVIQNKKAGEIVIH